MNFCVNRAWGARDAGSVAVTDSGPCSVGGTRLATGRRPLRISHRVLATALVLRSPLASTPPFG
jgi:hypothetical protein